jgi:hypothetical protein
MRLLIRQPMAIIVKPLRSAAPLSLSRWVLVASWHGLKTRAIQVLPSVRSTLLSAPRMASASSRLALCNVSTFSRVPGDDAVREHAARLTDSVGAIDRLRFNCRIPPRIEQEDVRSGGAGTSISLEKLTCHQRFSSYTHMLTAEARFSDSMVPEPRIENALASRFSCSRGMPRASLPNT